MTLRIRYRRAINCKDGILPAAARAAPFCHEKHVYEDEYPIHDPLVSALACYHQIGQ